MFFYKQKRLSETPYIIFIILFYFGKFLPKHHRHIPQGRQRPRLQTALDNVNNKLIGKTGTPSF